MDKLVSERDYFLSPSGNFVLIHERSKPSLVLQRVGEAGRERRTVDIPIQKSDDFFIFWTYIRKTNKEEILAVRKNRLYRIRLPEETLPVNKLEWQDITPWFNMTNIQVEYVPYESGKLVISSTASGGAARGIFSCRIESPAATGCKLIEKHEEGVHSHLFDRQGTMAGRIWWNDAAPDVLTFQVPDASTSERWTSTFSYTPSEERLQIWSHVDENDEVLALSNRNRKAVALVKLDIRSGREIVVSNHVHDIEALFVNYHLKHPLIFFYRTVNILLYRRCSASIVLNSSSNGRNRCVGQLGICS